MSFPATCMLLLTGSLLHTKSSAVSCYQCVNDPDPYCNRRACHHGLFGCIKTVTYVGGLDPSGIQNENPQHKMLSFKGCNMLPFGGLEGCRETSLIGDIRISTFGISTVTGRKVHVISQSSKFHMNCAHSRSTSALTNAKASTDEAV
uniref:UPAR/Ly6 domain-containing protein n=1 Tax=Trichuris muris TaxID=70415 RepID=A0A5S6QRR7_TRIMR